MDTRTKSTWDGHAVRPLSQEALAWWCGRGTYTFRRGLSTWEAMLEHLGLLAVVLVTLGVTLSLVNAELMAPTWLAVLAALGIGAALVLRVPPTLGVVNDAVRVNDGVYDTKDLVRIELFRVTPAHTYGDHAVVFVFRRGGRPRRVPLFVTGRELKAIVMGIKPILGDVRVSIRVREAIPIRLVF